MQATVCPRELWTPQVDTLLGMVRMVKFGILPVSGGWLDQTQSFADGAGLLIALGME